MKDAEWIAVCVKKDLVRGSYVPDAIIRQLRQYDRMIFDLNKEIVRKLTKLDACIQRTNIRISNYVSTIDSKGYRSVVEKIACGITDPAELLKCIHGRTINRWGKDVITASLCGVITEADVDIIRMYKEEVDLAQRHKDECQQKMAAICREHFPEQLSALQTIPGIKER